MIACKNNSGVECSDVSNLDNQGVWYQFIVEYSQHLSYILLKTLHCKFPKDMIFDIPYIVNWNKIGWCRQKLVLWYQWWKQDIKWSWLMYKGQILVAIEWWVTNWNQSKGDFITQQQYRKWYHTDTDETWTKWINKRRLLPSQ